MIRIVVENFLLFLLPTLAYAAYRYWSQGGNLSWSQILDEAPVIWLSIAGLVLVAIFLVGLGSTGGGRPDQTYYPAEYKDGKLVPGGFK